MAIHSTDVSHCAPAQRRRDLRLESLENRRQLSVNISNVHLSSDTGSSNTDRYTSVPAISGSATSGNNFAIQFDHNGNGVVMGTATLSGGSFSYDPLAHDSALSNWEGALNERYRTVEYDSYGGVIGTSAWNNFNMTLDRVAPTSSGIADVSVNENDPATTIDLTGAFHDGGTASSSLAFQVVGNTDSSFFSSVTISSSGVLTLSYAHNQWGNSDVTVRAKDLAGNTKDVTFNVDDAWIDQPPVVANFTGTHQSGSIWTFSGTVTDDSDPTGYVVTFGGVLASYGDTATVQADGTFSLTAAFFGLQPGTATAQTTDAQLMGSNVATYTVV